MLYFTVNNWKERYTFTSMEFSGGEVQLSLPRTAKFPPVLNSTVCIHATLQSSSDIMQLMQARDILKRKFPSATFTLSMGYIPYARQDRVCAEGESLAIKVFADILNTLNFNMVTVADPHSDVAPALINNCHVMEQYKAIRGHIPAIQERGISVVVAPDAGATKKAYKVAYEYHFGFVQGVKHRDTETGALTGFDAYGDVLDKDVLIVDDICDGGGTFIGLAKVLKEKGARSVSLYVTHGIFSKGLGCMLDTYIDYIYTTDSFKTDFSHPRLEVKPWRQFF